MAFLSYILTDDQRDILLEKFPPRYPDVMAHHITIWFDCPLSVIPPQNKNIIITGIADDGHGIQALIVTVDGQSIRTSDGYPYHITWSIDSSKMAPAAFDLNNDPALRTVQPYQPLHSNKLISVGLWTTLLDQPVSLGSMNATLEE